MRTKYEVYCLGGNKTAVIMKNLNERDGFDAIRKIMRKHAEVEQVAIVEKVEGDKCTFRMAGGEFCGNACRAVAEFMRRNYGKDKCSIMINRIEVKGKSNGMISEIVLSKSSLVRKVAHVNGRTLVEMNGITHVVVECEGNEELAIRIKNSVLDLISSVDALGVMFLEGSKINPFVWVERVKTFFNETACLSGSIAVALHLGSKTTRVVQPSGQAYLITVRGEKISASGRVEFLFSGEV